jgi:zinc protease
MCLLALLGIAGCNLPREPVTVVKAEEEILNYDQVQRYILDNGMTVILKETPSPLLAIQVWVKTGSINEGELLGSGVSHYVEHMLFKGTEQREVGQFAREIRQLGGSLNAYTSLEQTVYHLVLPAEHLDKGLEVMADAIQNSSFDPQECEREKSVILKEINMGDDDPDRYMHKLFHATVFTRHPYRHPVIGYRQVFSSLTRRDLLDYYQRQYVPSQMMLIMVGGLNPAETRQLVQKYWGDFNRRLPAPLVVPAEPPQLQPKRIEKEFPLEISRLSMGFPTVNISHEDLYPLDVLAILLGKGRSSRLYRRLKEEAGVVYKINAYSYTPSYKGYFAVSASLDYENLPRAEELIWNELEKVKRGEITVAELNKAKNQVISELLLEQETVEGQAQDLGLGELLTGDYKFSARYLTGISRVSQEQLMGVAQRYFQRDKQVTVVLKPPTSEAVKPEAPSPVQAGVEIKKWELDNGLTVLVRENRQLPLVTLNVAVKGGVRAEQEHNNGIFNFIQHMLLKGTRNLSGEQIAQTLESVGGRIDTESGSNSSLFTITVQKKDFELGLDLLSDILMNPSFPADELENARAKIIADIKAQEDELIYLARKLFMKTLFQQHPYRLPVLGSEQSVMSITRNDLVKMHQAVYVPNNMVLAIFGDVVAEEVVERVKQVWGRFEAQKMPPLNAPKEEALIEIRAAQLAVDKKQTVLMLGYPGIDILHKDRYAFQVLTYILSGQGSRVFDNLREKQGLAYYAGAFMFNGIDAGAYIFYVGTTPDKLEAAQRGLLTEIDRLRRELVTEDELHLAKQNIIGNRLIARQQNQTFAEEAGLDELLGLGYEEVNRFEQGIRQVTREDIQRIAREYFIPEAYVTAAVGALPK